MHSSSDERGEMWVDECETHPVSCNQPARVHGSDPAATQWFATLPAPACAVPGGE